MAFLKRSIKSPQRLPRMLVFRVTGTGTAAINEGSFDASLVDNGTGDYTLTFTVPFVRVTSCVGSLVGTSGILQIATQSATSVRVKTFAVDGTTATDKVFSLHVVGFDSADQI